MAQFRKFNDNRQLARQNASETDADAPANGVTWYDAAEYCNWLSKEEGISPEEWCYDPSQKFGDGMKLHDNYLQRKGYRLPTEAEWEYACRAEATTARYFGETEDLLGNYAWYTKNSLNRWMLSGGSLKPNDFGLFDVLGNALEWCQDQLSSYARDPVSADEGEQEQSGVVRNDKPRVLRGGAFIQSAPHVRSAYRGPRKPLDEAITNGFRPARTYP